MSDTSTIPDVDLDAAPPLPDDHEPFAHIVGQHDLEAALLNGGLVRAICGYEFNPKIAWPDGLPMCQRCTAILGASR